MDAKDILTESALSTIELLDPGDAQQDVLRVLKVFGDKLLPLVHDDDVPGLLAPSYLFCDGKLLGPGVVVALKDRAVLGWMKGLLRKLIIEELPLADIEGVGRDTKPAGGDLGKPLASLRVTSRREWELLFTEDADGRKLRDVLAKLLIGESEVATVVEAG